MIRKLGSAALALSVITAIISLTIKSGIGVSYAFLPPADFSLSNPKAEITHEIANCGYATVSEPISCTGLFNYSDSFEITTNLAVNNTGDFFTDLNQIIFVVLSPSTCATLTNSTVPGGFVIPIPGSDLKKHTNKVMTTYSFEGNVQGFPLGETVWTSLPFDRVELTFKFPSSGSPTVSLDGNANLCHINGPMALSVSFGGAFDADSDADIDSACVDIPAPELDTLDISQTFCVE